MGKLLEPNLADKFPGINFYPYSRQMSGRPVCKSRDLALARTARSFVTESRQTAERSIGSLFPLDCLQGNILIIFILLLDASVVAIQNILCVGRLYKGRFFSVFFFLWRFHSVIAAIL